MYTFKVLFKKILKFESQKNIFLLEMYNDLWYSQSVFYHLCQYFQKNVPVYWPKINNAVLK